MSPKTLLALLAGTMLLAQSAALANDIEKVMDKALSSGKNQLLKKGLNLGKLSGSGTTATPAAAGTTPAATPAANVTPAATPAATGTAANTAAPAATTAAAAKSSKDILTDKIKNAAVKEGTRYGKKYLERGQNSLTKFIDKAN
ncbi:MAG: hypothetical protein K2X27_04355 [Candidatus Obscuribacterales bacterium]|nr:hypothetical protein [Candidatus Obscuribacterales bacterium]